MAPHLLMHIHICLKSARSRHKPEHHSTATIKNLLVVEFVMPGLLEQGSKPSGTQPHLFKQGNTSPNTTQNRWTLSRYHATRNHIYSTRARNWLEIAHDSTNSTQSGRQAGARPPRLAAQGPSNNVYQKLAPGRGSVTASCQLAFEPQTNQSASHSLNKPSAESRALANVVSIIMTLLAAS